jgi:hypothetical protein
MLGRSIDEQQLDFMYQKPPGFETPEDKQRKEDEMRQKMQEEERKVSRTS